MKPAMMATSVTTTPAGTPAGSQPAATAFGAPISTKVKRVTKRAMTGTRATPMSVCVTACWQPAAMDTSKTSDDEVCDDGNQTNTGACRNN